MQCRQAGQPLEERLIAALAGQGLSQDSAPPVWLQSFEVEVRTASCMAVAVSALQLTLITIMSGLAHCKRCGAK